MAGKGAPAMEWPTNGTRGLGRTDCKPAIGCGSADSPEFENQSGGPGSHNTNPAATFLAGPIDLTDPACCPGNVGGVIDSRAHPPGTRSTPIEALRATTSTPA